MPIIQQNLAAFLDRWGQSSEDVGIINSTIRVLLAFEYYQPNIGYVPGLEKIVYYIRKLSDEATAFYLLFNFLFNSRFLWGYVEAKKTITEQHLAVFEKLCNHYPALRKSFELNKLIFQKFFVTYSTTFFLDVFDPSTVEKIIDHLVVFGDAVLFVVGMLVVEEFSDLDLSEFGAEGGVEKIAEYARKIDPIKICHKLLTAQDDYEYIAVCKRDLVK